MSHLGSVDNIKAPRQMTASPCGLWLFSRIEW